MIKTKCARKWLENVHNTPESRKALIEKYKEWNVNENMPEQIYSENEETNEHRVTEEEKRNGSVKSRDEQIISENEKTNEHRVIEEEKRDESVKNKDEMNIQGNCEIMVKEQPKNIQAKMACKEEDKRGDENGDETAEVQNWEKIKEIVRKKLKKGKDKSETDSAIGSRSDQSTGSREDILESTDIIMKSERKKRLKIRNRKMSIKESMDDTEERTSVRGRYKDLLGEE